MSLPSISLYKRIAVSFISFVVILILLLSYFSLGQATIKIEPKKKKYHVDFFINVGQKNPTAEIDNFVAGKVLKIVIEDTKTFSTTGKKKSDSDGSVVVGKIMVKNDSDRSYNFIAKTRFLSKEGILFRMQGPATIPANGTVEVDVYPDDPKFTGSLEPTSFTIPGLGEDAQKVVYGVTEKPLVSGGSEVYFLTEEDVAKAKEDLSKQLKEEALVDLGSRLKFREKIFDNASSVKIIEEKLSKKIGDIGDNFDLSLKLEVVAVSLSEQDLANDIQIKIAEHLPVGTELVSFDPEMVKYEMEKYDEVNQVIVFKVVYDGETIINKDDNVFNKENLIGQTKKEAIDSLSKLEDVKSVEVELSPFWVRHIPNAVDRINMVLVK